MSVQLSMGGIASVDGRLLLVTQGLTGALLAAAKQCLFRIYLGAGQAAQVDSVVATITSPSGVPKTAVVLARAQLTIESGPPHGPSVGLILRGVVFPRSGTYTVDLSLRDNQGVEIMRLTFELVFLPTFDLRVLIVPLQGSAPDRNFLATSAWFDDLDRAMRRLGVMFPVRDCVDQLDTKRRQAGLRYRIGAVKEAWPLEVGLTSGDYDAEELAIANGAGTSKDVIDASMRFRWWQPKYNEGFGGSAPYCVPAAPRRGGLVGGFTLDGTNITAPGLAHEIGHLFCMEPDGSPASDGLHHAAVFEVADPFAYDFLLKRPFPAPGKKLGNVMGSGLYEGADSVAFDSFAWNYMLTESFPKLALARNPTGSDLNPALVDPCSSPASPPRSPKEWLQIFGSRADGPLWVWTPHGPRPVGPQPSPLVRASRPAMAALQRTLRLLDRQGVEAVHVPTSRERTTGAVVFVQPFCEEAPRSRRSSARASKTKRVRPVKDKRAGTR